MAKIHNLEHLDGKRVKWSTLTAQYPDVFVNRKSNTGEMIITSDTDNKYGMHHIYLGGQHIASGYGFAASAIRNDLCYIQETYNGIFTYFNNAYSYHNTAYNWLKSYVFNAYEYVVDSILYNSYYNTQVNPDNDTISINDFVSYQFSFDKGVLNITCLTNTLIDANNTYKYLSLSAYDYNVNLSTTLYEDFNIVNNVLQNIQNKDLITNYELLVNTINENSKYNDVQIIANRKTSYINHLKNSITERNSQIKSLYNYFIYAKYIFSNQINNEIDENEKTIGEYYLNNVLQYNNENISWQIPLKYAYDISLSFNYKYDNQTNILKTKPFYYVWLYPIKIGTKYKYDTTQYNDKIHTTQFIDFAIGGKDNIKTCFVNYKQSNISTYTELITISKHSTYIIIAIPNKRTLELEQQNKYNYEDKFVLTKLSKPKFYISLDTAKKGDLEGGFTLINNSDLKHYNIYNVMTYNSDKDLYNVYISEVQNHMFESINEESINKYTIRIDIDF